MLYKIAKSLVRIFVHIFFRLTIHNIENFPKDGACLVASNHRSFWDAPLCAAIAPRQLFFMAKQEMFNNKLVRAFMKWVGAFPVSRGTADIGAIKTAMTLLKHGKCVAIFPEGTRVKEGQEHDVKSGITMIASKTKAPVVPIAIKGKFAFRQKIDIYIGSPIYVEKADGSKLSHEEIDEFSKQIMYGVLKMAGENVESLSC